MAKLGSLCLELVRHILSFLQPIQSAETEADVRKDRAKELSRQRANHERRLALHALTLTTLALNEICNPFLYSAIILTMSLPGVGSLLDLRRTFSTRPALAGYVKYVENRTYDCWGRSLRPALRSAWGYQTVITYFDDLGDLLTLCPNIAHANLVSLEDSNLSLWVNVIGGQAPYGVPRRRGLQQLTSLCVQVNTSLPFGPINWTPDFELICSALSRMPSLNTLRTSFVADFNSHFPTNFGYLTTIHLNDTFMTLAQLCDVVETCLVLKHFSCSWQHYQDHTFDARKLLKSLRYHEGCLESFEIAHPYRGGIPVRPNIPIGGFGDFTSLKTLKIDHVTLLGPEDAEEEETMPISELLPPSLENLHLGFQAPFDWDNDHVAHCPMLWDLVKDDQSLPDLCEVTVTAPMGAAATFLQAEFAQQGVNFRVLHVN
ncbi:hypothetical protein EJ04DRAFT_579360 [Polyplosphaeria fusca]|uniref:Uncharacterized protein n=1 Tax=Polyplosphaeria fusca TaxID=682080 RepID=A0A9P4UZL6_9PLEO|nr:hypothetical protein EJ04DRAFT_579360 [Polyplosphaeria fusca]